MSDNTGSGYGLSNIHGNNSIVAPALDYLPPATLPYRPRIGLIGAGGISEYHLRAYRAMGLDVAVICDVDGTRAAARQREFYPDAAVETDYRSVMARDDIEVVDVATHPRERMAIIPAAIARRKHVLSQKPFVTDLDVGLHLVELAARQGVCLAVNQNGRWAPHFSYLRQAVHENLIGPLASVDFCLHWDHTWTVDTPFNEIHHLLLYDFGIHWFDMATALLGEQSAERVFASVRRASFQLGRPPLLAHAVIDYPSAQVRISLNGLTRHGQDDRTTIVGRDGTLSAWGPGVNDQQVEIWTDAGHASPALTGSWFTNGFQGTIAELLTAIHEGREPSHSGRNNLRSLELCFAALASADRGEAVVPGSIRRLDGQAQ